MNKITAFVNTLQHISDNAILNSAFYLGIRIIICVAALVVGIIIVKVIKKLIKRALKKTKVDVGVQGFIVSFLGIALYLILGFLIASGMGVDAATIVALLGSLGVAIGLAIQGSLSNLAGGVLLLVLRPFKVGDYIIEDSNKNEGTVTEIGLFYTKLQTLDDRTVICPNGTLANTSITNVTQTPFRLIDLKFNIAYSADVEKAYGVIREVIESTDTVLVDKGVETYMSDMKDSSIEVAGRFYVRNANYRIAKAAVLEGVKKGFDAKGIEIPFPQIVVHDAK